MQNLAEKYHQIALEQDVVRRGLRMAAAQFPGAPLSYCGRETSWQDCLTAWQNTDTNELTFVLWFNIGDQTYTTGIRIDQKGDGENE